MATEKGLGRLLYLYVEKIKRLRRELEGTMARKKDAEVQLRELKWEAKEKKKAPKKIAKNYPDEIDKKVEEITRGFKKATKPYPIEKIVAKVLKKATKKKAAAKKKA